MKVVVYGLGNRGREFINDVREINEIDIVAATDTYVQEIDSSMCNNILYIRPIDIRNYNYDYIVITPESFHYEIKEQLLRNGISSQKIIFLNEFTENMRRFHCNICGSAVLVWKYIGQDNKIFHSKKIAGAGKRRGGCAVCGSSDRARFVYYIMENFTGILNESTCSILHFAPELAISEKLRAIHGNQYISADIVSERADVVADITELQFEEEQFGYVICNHVMEHVYEESKAFLEIRRCLQPGGILIFTAPICWSQNTYEDDSVVTASDKIKYYGQEDHVRLYGNDIVERIASYGFDVELLRCNEIINEKEIKKFGFLKEDSVLLCKKTID